MVLDLRLHRQMELSITKEMVDRQAYLFFVVPLMFILFLIIYPYFFEHYRLASLIFLIFPGAFLYGWMCFLIHETWHKYIHTIPNDFLFNLYSWLLMSEPQVYKICHGAHHRHTHTWMDIEFYPLGYIKNKYLRRLHNFMHFLIGQTYIYLVSLSVVSRKHPRFSWNKFLLTLVMITIIYSFIFSTTYFLLKVSLMNIIISFLLITFIGGSIQHHSQLLEHWGIIAEDKNWHERIMMSRNVNKKGVIEKVFLFFTHWDSHMHVLHHMYSEQYLRPFIKNIESPSDYVNIKIKDYLKIAKKMITD